MGFLDFLRRRNQPTARVVVSEKAVICTRSSGITESVELDDLSEVVIVTTDEGPFTEDVFFVLVGRDEKSGCAVPQSAEGCTELLVYLQSLPGFDNEAVIKAMGSTDNARFVCWKRENS